MDISKALLSIRNLPKVQPGSHHGTILGCMILCLLSFGLTITLLLFYPYGVNYGEAPLLNQARQIISNQNIYKSSLQNPPYVIANYTPIYPLLVGIIHRISHLPLFLVGRMLSILSALASSMLLGSMTRRLLNSSLAGYLATVLFLGHSFVGLWSGVARVDMLALAFSLAGVWIVCFHWRSTSWLVLAIVCLLASVYTRQTYLLAAPLGCAVWLIHTDRRRGTIFSATFILMGLVIFLCINSITHGGFYNHIVAANVNRFSFERIVTMGALFILSAPLLIFLTARVIRTFKHHTSNPFFVWGLIPYTVGAILTSLTVGKIGSDINYFLELVSVLAIWSACAASLKPGRQTSILLVSHTIWVVGLSLLLFQLPLVRFWHRLPEIDILAEQVKTATQNGIVLADDRLDLVVIAGQEIYYQPFEYTQLYQAGIWDIDPFKNAIVGSQFPLILIHQTNRLERWPDPIYNQILYHYVCTQQKNLLVCRP